MSPQLNASSRGRLEIDPLSVSVLTVAQVVRQIRLLIERQFANAVWIEGELSNCSYPSSGHIYFTLVDEKATDRFGQRLILPCAFFRNANQHVKFKLTDGLKVLVFGQVTTYEGRGQYQLIVQRVEPKGVGALQLAFEQLKKKLAGEGLFDPQRKRAIPRCPQRVAVITSGSGSAIHDMLSKLQGHFNILVLPVKVQGEGAASAIAAAIDLASTQALADVLIVGRGGGSVEDLWAFNEESVAYALARSCVPSIAAVGHQDDWTIADFVADMRASTPTDAAKYLVNTRREVLEQKNDLLRRLLQTVRVDLERHFQELQMLTERLRLLHPSQQLREYARRVVQSRVSLRQAMRFALEREQRKLQALAAQLQALSPLAVLARGYSVTFHRASGRVLTEASQVQAGDILETLVSKGKIVSQVIPK